MFLGTISSRNVKRLGISLKRSLANLREHKSIQETLNKISSSEKLKPQSYVDIIEHHKDLLSANPCDSEIIQVYELVSTLSSVLEADHSVHESTKNDFYNSVIKNFSKYDFASSIIASKKLSCLELVSLIEIVKYNPGRVLSSWEYFEKFGKNMKSKNDELHVEVLNKLVFGDKVDLVEGTTKLTIERAVNSMKVIKFIKDHSNIPTATMTQLINELIELKLSPFILLLKPDLNVVTKITKSNEDLRNWDYLYLWEVLNCEQKKLLVQTPNILLKFLRNVSLTTITREELSEEYTASAKSLEIPAHSFECAVITKEITDIIKEFKLDTGKETINSQFRLSMLRAVGFYCSDLKYTLELYTKYQLEAPNPSTHLRQLQSLVSSIVTHYAIARNDSTLLSFAEVLVPQIPSVPSSNISSFILYHSWFGNMDRSLELYNRALNSFMSKENPENSKHRGLLIQSLILCAVLKNDLELAQFIKTKAKENQLYDEEFDIKINQNLKDYGDLVEVNPDKEELRMKVGKIVQRTIRDAAFI